MKIAIVNYTFDKTTGRITCSDYAIEGIGLRKLLAVVNVTRGVVAFAANDANLGATIVAPNIIDLNYNTSSWADSDELYIVYDDPNAALKVDLNSNLDPQYDGVIAEAQNTTPVRLTASGQVSAAATKIVTIVIADGSTGSIKLWNNTAGSGTVLINTITLPVGIYSLHGLGSGNGLYCTITGTVDVTFGILPIL